MIRFENVHIGYQQILLQIPILELQAGMVYALVGANGAGKSTLLKTIIGEIPVISGQLLIENKSISSISAKERARKIAFVESRFDGIPHLSVQDYVALGRTPFTSLSGKLSPEDKAIVQDALLTLNISQFSSRMTSELSDGERQLCAIARALVQSTPLIALDEPTAFLDYGNRQQLIHRLKEIAQITNKCILFSSHDIDLCLEERLSILLINKMRRELELHPSNLSKQELLAKGFQ